VATSRKPTDASSLGFDFNAALAAAVDGCLERAVGIGAELEALLEDFVTLQEILVMFVPNPEFNRVFQALRLTDLRILLAAIAGRVEVVTDSPGLPLHPKEARRIRERVAAGDTVVPVSNLAGQRDAEMDDLRTRLAEARAEAERRGRLNGTGPAG
jgi:hypothetical protein